MEELQERQEQPKQDIEEIKEDFNSKNDCQELKNIKYKTKKYRVVIFGNALSNNAYFGA